MWNPVTSEAAVIQQVSNTRPVVTPILIGFDRCPAAWSEVGVSVLQALSDGPAGLSGVVSYQWKLTVHSGRQDF